MWTIPLPLYVYQSKQKQFALNLNSYRNAHYQILNKVKIRFTNDIKPLLKGIPQQPHIKLTYVVYLPSNRRADILNIGSVVDKFFSDTLVEAGVLQDDDYKHLSHVEFLFGGVDKVNPRVEAHITPLNNLMNQEETTMQLTLSKQNVLDAVTEQISTTIVIQEGFGITNIDFNADGSASVSIEPLKASPKAKAPKAVTKPKSEKIDDALVEEADEEENAPFETNAVAPEEEETADAPAKPSKSLFGGLQRPKN